jgi:CubicO group peptidase (beta-lactamase class C family)
MVDVLPVVRPEEAGVDPGRYARLGELLRRWFREDSLTAAAVAVGRRGKLLEPIHVGRLRVAPDSPPLPRDALFLVASIAKPVTVTAAMILVERGELALDDAVARFVPAFAANGKEGVRIRHVMTHTSGLPDLLPDNQKLRMEHRPLAAFVDGACKVPLKFAPGTSVGYQSVGTMMLGEVVRVVSGTPLPEFLRREVFEPLGMRDTRLGWANVPLDRIAEIRAEPGLQSADWYWNSPYWRGFGAPWGGLVTTAADLARFCQMFLNHGELGGAHVLSPASVRAMATNQLDSFPSLSEEERRCRPWGLGWRLHWPGTTANFGDLLGPRSYGHWGATGTVCWVDPDAEAFAVALTTQPQEEEGRLLAAASNAIAASFER